MTQDQHKLEPCPWCGGVGVDVVETSTFRWRVAQCKHCGAQCSEIRVQTMGDGTREEWEAKAHADAIEAWNTRAHLQQRPLPVRDDETMRAEFMAWVESQGCDTDGAWSAWQGCWNLLHGSVSAVLIPAKHWDKNVVHEWSGPLPVIDGTERDALRYRWLRDTGYWYTSPKGSPWAVIGAGAGDAMPCCGQELDAAIDAGMADMPPASPSLPVREEPTTGAERFADHLAGELEFDSWMPKHGDKCATHDGGRCGCALARASSPSVQNMGEGETGKDGVKGAPAAEPDHWPFASGADADDAHGVDVPLTNQPKDPK